MTNFIQTYWLEIILAFLILCCMVQLVANEFAHKEVMDNLHRNVEDDENV